jgi:hypothetical protein
MQDVDKAVYCANENEAEGSQNLTGETEKQKW